MKSYSQMERERFSLLLLDPGEIYFEDFSAVLISTDVTPKTYDLRKQDGRLKMCSRSLVFDPKDITKPIVKVPLKDCQIIEQYKGSAKFISNSNVLYVKCRHYFEMLESNIIAPYKFCDSASFLFTLKYANIQDCLAQICQLQRASTLPAVEQSNMIAAIVLSRHSRITFDPLWLDLYEKILIETQADKITPLVVNPGRVVLSNSRLYFQPYNNIETYPVLKINLNSIKRIVKRRFLLRHIGLEILSEDVSHLYLSFCNPKERDRLYTVLMEQPELNLHIIEQDVMTLQWQNGIISNYDYLLYLNSLADRSMNDLTQYPVFPWIVSDYTSQTINLNDPNIYRDLSKPVGALNDSRLEKLMDRFSEMPEPKYIYGSHYSTPAFVLFYLVRLYPNYMLCLQNGRFDHPDRMFNSLADVFRNCMINMTDFKELIPEFYDVTQSGKFLVNDMGINFGYRHNGLKVDHVSLPPWAENPQHFIKTLRDALESEIVSKNLHQWIDLIFGYKQTGCEALKAKNLFYHLCYEGNVDLDSISDINERHTHEIQIMEFGQIPKQVFKVPHPQRKNILALIKEPSVIREIPETNINEFDDWSNVTNIELQVTFTTHKDAVSDLFITSDCNRIISVGYDSKLKVFSLETKRQIRNANLGKMPLSSFVQLPNSNTLVIGSFENNLILYDMDFGRITQTIVAHEDAVTCMAWGEKLNLLCSGSGDCTVRLWKGFNSNGVLKPVQCLMYQLDHNSSITALTFNKENTYLAVGTEDGDVYVWDLQSKALYKKISGHTSSVKGLNYSPDGHKIASCGQDKLFRIVDVNTGLALCSKMLESPLLCLKWESFLLMLGSEDGTLYIWNIVEVKMLFKIKAHNGPVTVVSISTKKNIIATGSADQLVKIWRPT